MKEDNEQLQKIKTYYDQVYYVENDTHQQNYRHLNRLLKKVNLKKGKSILDIACGRGEWLKVCSSHGLIVSGIDISEKAIELCKSQIPDSEFYVQEAENLGFSDDSFDYVSCLGSLEHFVDPVHSLKEMIRVAKKDAEFIILVPNADFLTRKLKLYSGTGQKDAKEVVRTLDEWESLFELAGLKVISKWKDLHVLSWEWISMNGWKSVPIRWLQAVMLLIWPLRWQYQVYHKCISVNK